MDQEINGNANKLAERILDDARADAERTLSEARSSADALKAAYEKQMLELSADFQKKRDDAVHSVLEGAKTRAFIDGRKTALAKKRAVIERAFELASQRLSELPDAERKAIIQNVLLRETEGGETIVPAPDDRAVVGQIVSELSQKRLSLSAENAPFSHGCVVRGNGYEKDCSFSSILNEARGRHETDVAKLLFDRTEGE